jgi:molybdenum cofactor cytidylyltransferase
VRPAAIVLAGGAASRFGGNKLAADLEGRPVLEYALRAVAAVASPVVLVVGP